MRMLGIDPGYGRTGWGVIEQKKRGAPPVPIAYGCVDTPASMAYGKRLQRIADDLAEVCKKYAPDAAAVEKLYFSKNVTTALAVGEARGVVLLTLERAGIMVIEIAPAHVKLGVTGYGRADKKQVGQMVKIQLKLAAVPQPDDTADALAIALAALFRNPHV